MDLNQLYFDHQTLLMQAKAEHNERSREQHCAVAPQIARRMTGIHRQSGAQALRTWERRELAKGTSCDSASDLSQLSCIQCDENTEERAR